MVNLLELTDKRKRMMREFEEASNKDYLGIKKIGQVVNFDEWFDEKNEMLSRWNLPQMDPIE